MQVCGVISCVVSYPGCMLRIMSVLRTMHNCKEEAQAAEVDMFLN
jgi:hypothetical protein